MQLRFAARSTDAGGGCHSLGKQLSTNLYHLHDWQSSPTDADQVATEHTGFFHLTQQPPGLKEAVSVVVSHLPIGEE